MKEEICVNDPRPDPCCTLDASVKLDNNGKFITSWRVFPAGEGEADPEHLARDADGNMYISERGNQRI